MYTVANVDALFMTGITAGVENGTVKLNDVIIADAVGDYATGKLKDDDNGDISWLKEIHEVMASTRLLSSASAVTRDEDICRDINTRKLRFLTSTTDAPANSSTASYRTRELSRSSWRTAFATSSRSHLSSCAT